MLSLADNGNIILLCRFDTCIEDTSFGFSDGTGKALLVNIGWLDVCVCEYNQFLNSTILEFIHVHLWPLDQWGIKQYKNIQAIFQYVLRFHIVIVFLIVCLSKINVL